MIHPLRCRWLAGACSAASLGLGPMLAGEAEIPATPGLEEKPFVLFMGAEIDVQQGKDVHRVKDVTGDSFVIHVKGKPVEVATNRDAITLKVAPQLKLTDKTADIKSLKFERAYTPDNDPYNKWSGASAASASQSAVGTSAVRMGLADMGVQVAIRSANTLAGTQVVAFGGPLAQVVTSAEFNAASREANSDMNSAGYMAAKMQEELDKKLFDAVRLNFEVSAPQPLSHPYIIVITQYREKDAPPGAVKHWIYARALERLDQKPLKVRLLKGGFPEGFELLNQQVHLYGGGRELGTNVAERQLRLTRDEAHEYILIDHLAANKTGSVPPSIALGVSRKDLEPLYSGSQLAQAIYIKVDPRGLAIGSFQDERCTTATGDARLEALVGRVRFKPALQGGKAVDGVLKVKLADLAI